MATGGATFTMSGGTISGNEASEGGGVHIYSFGTYEATFTMSGNAAISGNTATYSGGGVYASSNSNGTFTMASGTIGGNTALYGSGVYVYNYAIFTKTGGIIYGDSPADTTTTQNSGPNANTATSTSYKGTNGHAVLLFSGGSLPALPVIHK